MENISKAKILRRIQLVAGQFFFSKREFKFRIAESGHKLLMIQQNFSNLFEIVK